MIPASIPLSEIKQLRDDLAPFLDRGDVAYAGGHIDESLGDVAEIAWVLNVRGAAAIQAGDLQLARVAFEAAVALAPRDEVCRTNLALACLQLRDLEAASSAFRSVVALNPGAQGALAQLASFERSFGRSPSTLYAFYDLGLSPPTFDVVVFLALAELARRRKGLDALRVIFVPGPSDGFRDRTPRDKTFGRERKAWRLRNVLVPACRLVSASQDPVVCTNRGEALLWEKRAAGAVFPEAYQVDRPRSDYEFNRLLGLAAEGSDVRVLEAPKHAAALIRGWLERHAHGRAAVTITLRESDFEPERNSDKDSWARVAQWLENEGLFPVIVPDTEALLVGAGDWSGAGSVCCAAALNVECRAALYAASELNLMLVGGNFSLCLLSAQVRCVLFLRVLEDLSIWSTAGHKMHFVPPGEQVGFAGEFQRMAWTGDGYESVVAEAQAMLGRMRAAGIAPRVEPGMAAERAGA